MLSKGTSNTSEVNSGYKPWEVAHLAFSKTINEHKTANKYKILHCCKSRTQILFGAQHKSMKNVILSYAIPGQ